ncbi:MAG: amidoligase family protein [Lachnospiraceae bacterium]|nr:amidoligase family protein [Lachnospiraceae bacterium]
MRTLKYGVEIEFLGITREAAAEVLADFFGTGYFYEGGELKERDIADEKQRIWRVVRDASIDGSFEEQCELVTPILLYEDLEIVSQVLERLKEAGAVVNKSCGLHIHVDAKCFTPQAVVNLVTFIGSREQLLYKALEIPKDRMRYCKRINDDLVSMILEKKPKSMEELRHSWYLESPYEMANGKYHSTRYHGLNLHSMFTRGTIEFRLFNSSLEEKVVRSYIQFVLALSKQAQINKKAVMKKTKSYNEKYAFRCFLLRLGLSGDEYKDCRRFLLRNLTGDSAWKG